MSSLRHNSAIGTSFRNPKYRKHVFDKTKEDAHTYFGNWKSQNVSVAYRRLFRQPGLLQILGKDIFSPWDLELMSIDAPTAQTPFRFSDLVGLLYFKLLLEGTGKESYGHIAVAEAQDIPVLFFDGLSRFTPQKSITILGDIGQGIFPNNGLNNWDEIFPIFPTLNRQVEELRVCYRSTFEIMNYANSMLSRSGVSEDKLIRPLNRPGKPVQLHPSDSEDEWAINIIKAIQAGQSDGYRSIAIICKSAQDCRQLADLFQKYEFRAFDLVDSREKSFQNGVTILPAYLAKGLEFDVAIVADSHNYGPDDLSVKLLFVAITRAAHRLHIFWLGRPSPLLDERLNQVTVEPFLSEKMVQNRINIELYAQANRLDPDWCVEVFARTGILPLLSDGEVDSIVMDLLIQSSQHINDSASEDSMLVPLTASHEQILLEQVRKHEDSLEDSVQGGLALAETTYGLLKNHLRNLGLLSSKDDEQTLVQQITFLVRLRKLIRDAELNLPGGRWTSLQRLTDDVDQRRLVQFRKILQTLLRWHRELFRFNWRRKPQGKPKISAETIELIHKLVRENRLWGTERIRGELLKLGIEVSKRTIQKYMPKDRKSHVSIQTWATFLQNQAGAMWACDFTVMHDWLFRPWYIFVVMDLKTRRIVHTGVTNFPTDDWTAQQVREATPWEKGPRYLIRDRDRKYAGHFSAMAANSGIQELKTPYRVPQANGGCERFMGSLRRECLDHMLIDNGKYLQRLVQEYTADYNQERPHQGISQCFRDYYALPKSKPTSGWIISKAIFGGLHHRYARATNLN